MKIELIRKEEISGEIWVNVLVNGSCIQSFRSPEREVEANNFYNACVQRAKNGYPKISVLASEEITTNTDKP